jgi:adenosylhomocysteine nucleosidase
MTGIIGAMRIEVETIRSLMENKRSEVIGGVEYISGTLHGKEVVTAVCGIGKVAAAMCAQTMILRYAPARIINTGVGGAISNELNITDIAISNFVVQHDMDTSALGDPVGLISGINVVDIAADEDMISELCSAAEKRGARYLVGKIASGDLFVSGGEKKKYIEDTFGAIVCEMEGAAIGQVCYVNKVPFCVIRAVSDKADGSSSMDYMSFVGVAAKKNAEIVLEYLS